MRIERPSPHKLSLALLVQLQVAPRSEDLLSEEALTDTGLDRVLSPHLLQSLAVVLIKEVQRVDCIVEKSLPALCTAICRDMGAGGTAVCQYMTCRLSLIQSPDDLLDLFSHFKVREPRGAERDGEREAEACLLCPVSVKLAECLYAPTKRERQRGWADGNTSTHAWGAAHTRLRMHARTNAP